MYTDFTGFFSPVFSYLCNMANRKFSLRYMTRYIFLMDAAILRCTCLCVCLHTFHVSFVLLHLFLSQSLSSCIFNSIYFFISPPAVILTLSTQLGPKDDDLTSTFPSSLSFCEPSSSHHVYSTDPNFQSVPLSLFSSRTRRTSRNYINWNSDNFRAPT